MKYSITQKAVDDGIYPELWQIEIIASVDGYIQGLVENWYLLSI